MDSEKDMVKFDARLAEIFPADGDYAESAEDSAVAGVLEAFSRRRSRAVWIRIAAGILLLAAGLAAGLLLGGRAEPRPVDSVTTAMAEHERAVFAAVRESLGGDLAWLATHQGEVVLGFGGAPSDADLRVVFLELRRSDGEIVSRTTVVLPEGREVRVSSPLTPEVRVAALADDGDRRVSVTIDFRDGARLAGFSSVAAGGADALLGRVRTNGEAVSVYLSAF